MKRPNKKPITKLTPIFWALLGAATLGAGNASAAEKVLHSFTGYPNDGANPYYGGLIADSSGNLYGTTYRGGTYSAGTVFKLSPQGNYKVLHSFPMYAPNDGSFPYGGLYIDSKGNLYGTTNLGGANGYGVVFRLSPSGTLTVLHTFANSPNDGVHPYGGLIADSSGNLYGTTYAGGAHSYGTVFKLSMDGSSFTLLHSFSSFQGDGGAPVAGLIADTSGNLYGTTITLGAAGYGGTVFKLSTSGTNYKVLYSFCSANTSARSCIDGNGPYAGLHIDASGNLYGTTILGGAYGEGAVFKLSPNGTNYKVLYSFCAKPNCSDGYTPYAGVIADKSGNLYGTAYTGGIQPAGYGTVFKLAPDGSSYTVLHAFTCCSDGQIPYAPLLADSSGNLYGTTFNGGSPYDEGTVFELTGTGFVPP